MAIRFFAAAVASVGLVTSAFGGEPMPMAPAPMPATVMTQAMPMQTVKTGMFGRRTKMVPMTTASGSVMPAGYTTPMTGTVTMARADAPVQPMPTTPKAMSGTTTSPMPTTTAPVVTSTESVPSMAATPTTPARKRLLGRLSARRS